MMSRTAPAASAASIATIGVGMQPVAVTVDASTHAVYVANQGSNTVTVIDGATAQVIATIDVGKRPVSPSPPRSDSST